MKAAIVYWSKTGNTEKVAAAIEESLRPLDVAVDRMNVDDASDLDFF